MSIKIKDLGPPKDNKVRALIVVDMQHDFLEGSMKIKNAQSIVPIVNEYINTFVNWVVPVYYTKDWHTEGHPSFKGQGGEWPRHCVMFTDGAKLFKDVVVPENRHFIYKGFYKEAYSGFDGTNLHNHLQADGVKELVIIGVATEYCVQATVEDALAFGYSVIVPKCAVSGVKAIASQEALETMSKKGAVIL